MPEEKTIEQLLTEAREYVNNKKYNDAADTFEKVLTFQTDNQSTKFELFDALMKWGSELRMAFSIPATQPQYEQAKKVFERAAQLGINDARLMVNLGLIYS